MRSNSGLESRFTRFLLFEDYSPDELFLIFQSFSKQDQRIPVSHREFRCPAAHNAVGLAGESPAVGLDCLSTSASRGQTEFQVSLKLGLTPRENRPAADGPVSPYPLRE